MSNLNVAVTLRLINQLSGPAKEAAGDLKTLADRTKALDGAHAGKLAVGLKDVSAAGGKTSTILGQVAGQADRLKVSGAATGAMVRGLQATAVAGTRASTILGQVSRGADRLRSSGTATATMARGLEGVGVAGGRAVTVLSQLDRARLSGVRSEAESVARALAAAAREGERTRRAVTLGFGAVRPASSAVGKPAAPSDAGGSTIMAAGGGIVGAVGTAYAVREATRRTVGEAISFEKAMAAVKKKVDAPSPEGFRRLEGTIKTLSKELGIPAVKVAELTAEAGASGIAFQDLERFMRLTATAAVAWDMPAEEASQKLAEIKTANALTIGQVEVLGDKINALGDNSAAKERDIVEMFQRSGASAKEAGVSFDTTLAVLTAARSAGMQPEVASRWFNSFAGGLRTIQDGKKDAQEALKALGTDAKTVANGMKRDALGTIEDIFKRLETSPDAARHAIKLFGKEWWDETLRVKAAGLEIRKQANLLRDPSKYGGSMRKTLAIDLATTENHLKRLAALASDVGDRLGRWALPGINERVEKLMGLVKEFDERMRVRDAGKAPADAEGDPMGRLATAFGAQRVNELGRRLLDRVIAPRPTDDRSREAARRGTVAADDAAEIASKLRAEAVTLEAQSKNAKSKGERKELTAKADALRREAGTKDTEASGARRGAGPHAARDMTDVEVGEAAARRFREEVAPLRARMTELEAALAASGKVVQDPASGTFKARSVAEEELESVKAKLRELVGESEKAATEVKGKLSIDLSAEGSQAMASYTSGLAAGAAGAVAQAQATAGQIKAAFAGAAGAIRLPAGGGTGAPAGSAAPATTTAALRARMSSRLALTLPSTGSRGPVDGGSGATSGSSRGSQGGGRVRTAAGPNFHGPIHVHGVTDLAGIEREAMRHADRRARDAQGGALHDLGSYA